MLDFDDRLDGAHKAVLEKMPAELLDLTDIPRARTMIEGFMAAMMEQAPEIPRSGHGGSSGSRPSR